MRKIFWACTALLALLVIWAALHPLGTRFAMGIWPVPAGTPWTYQFLSGFVPALTVLTLLGAVFSAYHLHNCHQDGCWRLGKHKIDGTPWCSRHKGNAKRMISKTEELLEAIVTEIRELRASVEKSLEPYRE